MHVREDRMNNTATAKPNHRTTAGTPRNLHGHSAD
jgi:hypothetical protein